jgi:hypothetical protein
MSLALWRNQDPLPSESKYSDEIGERRIQPLADSNLQLLVLQYTGSSSSR